jgi:hypothetical protein
MARHAGDLRWDGSLELSIKSYSVLVRLQSLTESEVEQVKSLIRAMPLHNCADTMLSGQHVALSARHIIPPASVDLALLNGDHFLRSDGEDEAHLYTFLGVPKLTAARFYSEHVLPRFDDIDPQLAVRATAFALRHLPSFCQEDGAFGEKLSSVACIYNRSGVRKLPRELFDPEIPELHGLVDPEMHFPGQALCTPELLPMLRRLGLQVRLGTAGILMVATSIAEEGQLRPASAVMRSKLLLKAIDAGLDGLVREATSSPADGFWLQLRNIEWAPIMLQPPSPLLPWVPKSKSLASPKMTRPVEDLWLVSFSLCILDAPMPSKAVVERLGWNAPPSPQLLVTQLLKLSFVCSSMQQLETNSADSETLETAVMLIYSKLDACLSDEVGCTALAMLAEQPWLWDGTRFIRSEDAAFQNSLVSPTTPSSAAGPADDDLYGPSASHRQDQAASQAFEGFSQRYPASPFLSIVPTSLSRHKRLLEFCGVREAFANADYVRVLVKLHQQYGDRPLGADHFELAILLVNVLQDPNDSEIDEMYLPDRSGVLVHARVLMFDDAPWLSSNLSQRHHLRFVHSKVSNEKAEMCGASSLRKLLVGGTVQLQDLPCPNSASIANRLSTLPEGIASTIYDMLEVADAIGAKEVQLCFDHRHHSVQSLLQPTLMDFQAEALVMFLPDVLISGDELSRTVHFTQSLYTHKRHSHPRLNHLHSY